MKYLLDTCLISELVKPAPNENVIGWLNEVSSELLFISVLTIGEIHKGFNKSPESSRKRQLSTWLNTLVEEYAERMLPVDLKVAENWGYLQGNAENAGTPMCTIDGLIAATTHTYNLTLVTRNETDFAPSHIPIFNPWKS